MWRGVEGRELAVAPRLYFRRVVAAGSFFVLQSVVTRHLRLRHGGLKGFDGDRASAVMAVAGYNFNLLLRWLAVLLRALIATCLSAAPGRQAAREVAE